MIASALYLVHALNAQATPPPVPQAVLRTSRPAQAPLRIVLPVTAGAAEGHDRLPCAAGAFPFTVRINTTEGPAWRLGLELSKPGKNERMPPVVVTQTTRIVPTGERAELYQGSEAPLPGPTEGAFVERMELRAEAMVAGEGLEERRGRPCIASRHRAGGAAPQRAVYRDLDARGRRRRLAPSVSFASPERFATGRGSAKTSSRVVAVKALVR